MNSVNPIIQDFFEKFEKGINALDVDLISSLYADAFMFGGSQGVQSVKKEDFLKMLPKRQGFFATVGLKSTKLTSFDEIKLDDSYTIIKTTWMMHYEKDAKPPIDNETSATYILYSQNSSLQIVMQIDHQDLMRRVKELGLL
mgnify:CR=1 FL=1